MALSIAEEMAAFDKKNRYFLKNLTDDQKKEFSSYLMIRWGACVEGNRDIQEYYLMSTNEKLNKHFFDINSKEHAQLHWLMASSVSPGIGTVRHTWIGNKKKDGNSKIRKFIEQQYPTMKPDDVDVLLQLVDGSELKELAVALGMTKDQIKAAL